MIGIDISGSDPFADVDAEWGSVAVTGAYDLVAVVGELTSDVVAFAVAVGAPVVRLPMALAGSVPEAVRQVLVAGQVSFIPVLELTADGDRRFTAGTVDVVGDRPMLARWAWGDEEHAALVEESSLRPLTGSGTGVEVRFQPRSAARCHRLNAQSHPLGLRVDFDDRSRRAGVVLVQGFPPGLRVLNLAELWA